MITLLSLVSILSCDRVKQNSRQVVDKAKTELSKKKADPGDKVIPHYDAYNPDTRFNKK
jgi:hypothetical protein